MFGIEKFFSGNKEEKPEEVTNEAEEVSAGEMTEETPKEEKLPASLEYQKEVELMKSREVNPDGTLRVEADEKIDKAA
ncbi:MAG: hypothetical protein COU71_00445 [Parcubacteria group bacterium CG10_big_fil_rev_8_21_14_0_10_38_31]|nr:MAG: hypothetical protein COU71_00445 [Parcubacteria group bacterium CG10_big_fil_rev_8_21_14_0_10_38_31]